MTFPNNFSISPAINRFYLKPASPRTGASPPILSASLYPGAAAGEPGRSSYSEEDFREAEVRRNRSTVPRLWQPHLSGRAATDIFETEFQQELRQQVQAPISGWEFALEMFLGLPRGLRQMGVDARDNPAVVGGTIGGIIVLTRVLPNPYARWFSRGLLGIGVTVGTGFTATGLYRGMRAWERDDRTALREASVLFGVGVTSLALTYGGVRLGKYLEVHPRFSRFFAQDPDIAIKWAVFGSILHSTDEIAAVLAIFNSARNSGVGAGTPAP